MNILYLILLIVHTNLIGMDKWDIIRQDALAYASEENNVPNSTNYSMQDSYFLYSPSALLCAHKNNFVFDSVHEKEIIAKLNTHPKMLIDLIVYQAKIGLYLVENSEKSSLNNFCLFCPFKQKLRSNWGTNLLYAIQLLSEQPLSLKKLQYSLETLTRFFTGNSQHLPPLYSFQTFEEVKDCLSRNIDNAEYMLQALRYRKKQRNNKKKYHNYHSILGAYCLRKHQQLYPLDLEIFTQINNHRSPAHIIYTLAHSKYDLFDTIVVKNQEST